MVCARCQRLQKSTELTTPAVKLKNELNHTPQGSGGTSEYGKGKGSRTLTSAGITKNKLLSKNAKNPYASYSSSCRTCKARTEQKRALCHSCAYRANACAMCGKSQSKTQAGSRPVVEGQKFSSK